MITGSENMKRDAGWEVATCKSKELCNEGLKDSRM